MIEENKAAILGPGLFVVIGDLALSLNNLPVFVGDWILITIPPQLVEELLIADIGRGEDTVPLVIGAGDPNADYDTCPFDLNWLNEEPPIQDLSEVIRP